MRCERDTRDVREKSPALKQRFGECGADERNDGEWRWEGARAGTVIDGKRKKHYWGPARERLVLVRTLAYVTINSLGSRRVQYCRR
jgi:hypothetical protein